MYESLTQPNTCLLYSQKHYKVVLKPHKNIFYKKVIKFFDVSNNIYGSSYLKKNSRDK